MTRRAERTQILLVEDTLSLAELYKGILEDTPWCVTHVDTGKAAYEALREKSPAVVLLDLILPDAHGLDILRWIKEQGLSCSVVVITSQGSVNTAVSAMKSGAYDFLVKPFAADRLITTVRNALERQKLAKEVEILKQDFGRNQFCGFVGSSLAMQGVYRIIESAAPSKATVFITGESGTGKELCAEAIHQRSPRADGPFVPINCGAIPKELMESEIFGHIKGSFSGAIDDRVGAASLADGGTLFLDEICEMDLNLQTKLLRFIQTGSFQRVGSGEIKKVDVRFICATNRDPIAEVAAGNFREDLFYRLHVIPITMPPLRDREKDVLEIAKYALEQFSSEESKTFKGFTPEAEYLLTHYDWPGNVRQLQNVLRNAVVLNNGEAISDDMLRAPLGGDVPLNTPIPPSPPQQSPMDSMATEETPPPVHPLWVTERNAIEAAIAQCDGNIPKAAALLEVSPSTIYRKKQSWADMEG